MKFDICLSRRAVRDLALLDVVVAGRIMKKLKEIRSLANPMRLARPLKGKFQGLYRFRIGDYRVIFEKQKDGSLIILLVLTVKHRNKIYE